MGVLCLPGNVTRIQAGRTSANLPHYRYPKSLFRYTLLAKMYVDLNTMKGAENIELAYFANHCSNAASKVRQNGGATSNSSVQKGEILRSTLKQSAFNVSRLNSHPDLAQITFSLSLPNDRTYNVGYLIISMENERLRESLIAILNSNKRKFFIRHLLDTMRIVFQDRESSRSLVL